MKLLLCKQRKLLSDDAAPLSNAAYHCFIRATSILGIWIGFQKEHSIADFIATHVRCVATARRRQNLILEKKRADSICGRSGADLLRLRLPPGGLVESLWDRLCRYFAVGKRKRLLSSKKRGFGLSRHNLELVGTSVLLEMGSIRDALRENGHRQHPQIQACVLLGVKSF